ncbi:hypothetical protein JTB14_037350 [Gonioctena quinquepunctata]|nr:hypothetical protein JTB14_037350 [Gonioctena quinquepunctata]
MEEKSIQTISVILPKSPENSELMNGTIENEIQEEIANEIVEHVDDSTENRTLRDRNVLKVSTKYNDYVCMLSDDEVNFSKSENDPCIFYKNHRSGDTLFLVIFVDDGLIASTNESKIENLLQHLENNFKITREEVKCYLGMEISRNGSELMVTQENYIEK